VGPPSPRALRPVIALVTALAVAGGVWAGVDVSPSPHNASYTSGQSFTYAEDHSGGAVNFFSSTAGTHRSEVVTQFCKLYLQIATRQGRAGNTSHKGSWIDGCAPVFSRDMSRLLDRVPK
jgi:hypothetical protein